MFCVLQHTLLYQEIKGLCAMTVNCKDPNDSWSLQHGLMRRECGLTGTRNGSFSMNQHRRIANHFIPNKRIDRLMALDTKMFICCFNRDGSCLLTASQDAIIRIFDATNDIYHRVRRIRLRDMNWSILDIDFSPCGQYFAYSTWSNYCKSRVTKKEKKVPSHGNAPCDNFNPAYCRWDYFQYNIV